MTLFRKIALLFRTGEFRRRAAAELDRELQLHLEMRTDDLIAHGESPDEARRIALAEFGGVDRIREEWHDARGFPVFESFAQDVRFGARMIRQNPASTAVAAITLAFGIGANTAIFSAVHAVLLQPLPYRNGDRLLHLRQPVPSLGLEDASFSPPEARDYAASARSIDALAEYHSMAFTLLGHGEPVRVQTGVVSASFFDVMGVRPLMGRTFRPGEDGHDAAPVLVLSYGFWRNSLGGDRGIVGRTFEMNDRVHTVIGVLPPLPQYPDENDVYMPISSCPFRSGQGWDSNRQARGLNLFARARPGVPGRQVNEELSVIANRLHREYPDAYPSRTPMGITAVPLQEELTRHARLTFLLLLSTAGLVLLIASANVANLTLARLTRRGREFAVRAALGAGRGRLVRQLVTENTMIALLGGALGVGLAELGQRSLAGYAAKFTARASEIRIDGGVLLFALVVSILTGVVFGALPAFRLKNDLAPRLKDTTDAPGSATGTRFRAMLLVVQVAMSLVLLVGAGLLVKSLVRLSRVNPGFDPENVLTAQVSLDWTRYKTTAQSVQFYDRLAARLSALPQVRSLSVASASPLGGGNPWTVDLAVEGLDSGDAAAKPPIDLQIIGSDYFRTIGTPLLKGRMFDARDVEDSAAVAVVNAMTARRYWGTRDPVGSRINIGGNPIHWRTVVGVVGDVRQYGLDKAAPTGVYVPFAQFGGGGMNVLVRTAGDPERLTRELSAAVHAIDPTAPVSDVHTLDIARKNSLQVPRLTTGLLSAFALLALAIAAAGIGAVTAFSVGSRTREIGIRIALGASRRDVLEMVLRQSMVPVVSGVAVGLVASLLATRLLGTLLFSVAPTDLATFVAVAAALLTTATLACLLPGRRAMSVSPMEAFRAT